MQMMSYLTWGIGIAVLLGCVILWSVYSGKRKGDLIPFAASFAGTYYFFSIWYLMVLTG